MPAAPLAPAHCAGSPTSGAMLGAAAQPTAARTRHTSGGLVLRSRPCGAASPPLAARPRWGSPGAAGSPARPRLGPRPQGCTPALGLSPQPPAVSARDAIAGPPCGRHPSLERRAPACSGPTLAWGPTGVPAASPLGCSAHDPASIPWAETVRGPVRPGPGHGCRRETPQSGRAPHGLLSHAIAGPHRLHKLTTSCNRLASA